LSLFLSLFYFFSIFFYLFSIVFSFVSLSIRCLRQLARWAQQAGCKACAHTGPDRMASLEQREFIESFLNLQQAILWMAWLPDSVMIHTPVACDEALEGQTGFVNPIQNVFPPRYAPFTLSLLIFIKVASPIVSVDWIGALRETVRDPVRLSLRAFAFDRNQ